MVPPLLCRPLPTRLLATCCLAPGRGVAWVLLLLIWLLSFGAQAQAPANDDPCGAIQLTLNGNLCTMPTVGTTAGATSTTVNGTVTTACGGFSNPTPKDVWFKFTTATTGDASAGATITVTGNPAGLLRLFSAPSCTGTFTQVSCTSSNAANTAAPRLVTGALQPNTTYYIQVAGYGANDTQGPFTICVTDPPACGAPAVIGVTFPTATSASVAFTPGPGNGTFTVLLNGGTQTINNATSPAVFTGLTPGTTYFVSVRTDCNGTQVQSPFLSFTVPLLNDDPCGAISLPITTTCTPTTGTTFGSGTTTPNGYTNPGCAIDASPMDVWYQFTTPATGGASTSATVTVTGFPAGQVRLFSGASCSGALTQLACSASPTGPALPLSYASLTPNTTYYIMVAGYSDTSPRGTFNICVTGTAACPDPTNLVIAGTSTTSANLSFTPSPNATSYIVTYTPAGGSTTTVTPAPTGSPVALTGLTAGTTYTVTLQSVCPAGVGSVLTRTYVATSAAPSNDECAGSIPLTVGIGTCGPLTPGTFVAATASAGIPAPGCANYVNGDVWYSVTVPPNGILQAETSAATTGNVDTGLAFYSGSCGSLSLLGCNDDFTGIGTFSRLRLTTLTPGSTVYIRVWRYGGNAAGGTFNVCAQTDPLCPTVSNLAVGTVTSTTAQLTFTPVSGASSYFVTYTPVGGTISVVVPSPTGSPVTLTGLTPNTTYTTTIQASCTAGSGLPLAVTFTTAAPAPANDDCAGATALTVSTTCTNVTGTTLGATASAAPVPVPTCGNGIVNDVWYSMTVPSNGIVTVTTSGVTGSTVNDTGLQLYGGTCGALTSLGCNDNYGTTNFSQVRATGLTPGSTVYARVWQIGGGTGGQFTLCATTDPPCPPVTNLAVGSITPVSASVAFTPSSAGTSYTVTYTPAGGTATTVSPAPTGSPVALSGLTPATTYTVTVVSNCSGGLTSTAATTTFTTSTCLPPVTLAVGSITTTSAVVSFGVGNGSGYVVTYTAQGGSPQTLTPAPTGSPFTLSNLTPGTQYTVSIVSSCGPGQTSTPATVSFTTLTPPCNPVTGLSATNVTTTSASLVFTPATTGTSYTVTYTPAGGTATTVTPAPTGSPVALSALTPGTVYTVSIVTNCGSGQTSTAVTTTFTTTALPPCNPVTNLAVGSITTTSASVTFTPAATGTSYTVTYTPAGGTATTVTPPPTGSPVALSGLTPATTYTVSIVTNCGSGQTSTAVTTTFTTLSPCGSVTNLTVTSITPNSAVVNFTPVTGASSYIVTYAAAGGSPTALTPNPSGPPVTLTGLVPNTAYTVTVVAVCSGGQNSTAATTTFTTTALPPCNPVTNLVATAITTTSASLTFTPAATGTTYTVTYTPAGGTATTVTPPPTGSPVALSGLTPGTTYTVSVVSNCGSGQTSTAATTTFTTTAAPTCAPVTNLTVTAISTTTASVTFTPGAAGTTYTVTYTPAGGSATTVTPAPVGSPVALSGLTPGTAYTVSVVANCSNGLASAPATSTFTTLSTASCPSVTNLTFSNLTTTSVTATFTGGSGSTGYVIVATPVGTPGSPIALTVTSSPATITGLTPGVQYSVCVAANCGTQSSTPVCAPVTPASATCPTPTSLAVGTVTSTTASLSFGTNAQGLSYIVTYTPAGGSPQTAVVAGSPATLTGLTPNTSYTVSVATNCQGGTTSMSSAAVTFSTQGLAAHTATLAQQIGLHPNPAQRTFWLDVPAALTRRAIDVTLYNSIGQVVQQRTLPASAGSQSAAFDVRLLPVGVYSVHLLTTEGVLIKRLVVE